jgi:mRNA-degrading endonuclease RelE of RelBE toxin-antitoxin system
MYNIELDRRAKKFIDKSEKHLKEKLKDILRFLSTDPHLSEELKGDKKGIYSYHFFYSSISYRIAYTINESTKEVLILLIAPRENFYKVLSQLLD